MLSLQNRTAGGKGTSGQDFLSVPQVVRHFIGYHGEAQIFRRGKKKWKEKPQQHMVPGYPALLLFSSFSLSHGEGTTVRVQSPSWKQNKKGGKTPLCWGPGDPGTWVSGLVATIFLIFVLIFAFSLIFLALTSWWLHRPCSCYSCRWGFSYSFWFACRGAP